MGQPRLVVLHKDAVKQIYIAGRITGNRKYKQEFARVADKFRLEGWQTFNPAAAGMDDGRPLWQIMAYLLPRVCESQAIAMQRGWWRSGGARIEWLLAKYLGLKILYL